MLILDGHTSPVYALAFSPDSYLLASGTKDAEVRLWEPSGVVRIRQFPRPGVAESSLDFSPDGSRYVTDNIGGFVEVGLGDDEPTSNIKQIGRITDQAVAVRYLDARTVAVGTGNRAKLSAGRLYLYDLVNDCPRKPEISEPHGVRSVAAHPPSRTVAWSNGSRRVTVWDIVKPDPIHFNLPHSSPAVAFHPDGTFLAVAQEWDAKVFDIARRQEVATLKGHKGKVTSVAFAPDGRTLATGSWDGIVRLWDPFTGAERQAFQWPTGKVYALAFAPDGTRAAAAGEKGTIVVWDTE
jgi:WD40 repeat protein